MTQAKWAGAVLSMLLAGQAVAGEFTVDLRVGTTELRVDGDKLSSGDDVSDALMSAGVNFTYAWPRGPFVEFSMAASFNPFPIFGWRDVKHMSLAGGWQFASHNWYFKPKVGLTRSSLESQEEDFFDGDEPVDKIREIVPFVELGAEYRLWGNFGVGAYARQNFEDFGSTTMLGISLGWTFN